MLILSHWWAKTVFIYSSSWKAQVSWRAEGGLRIHWRLTHYRWDISAGRFLQVSKPFLSDHVPRLGPTLGSQRRGPRLFIPAANMITISPLYARHLPFPRCCHILCTPLILLTSWEASACLPISHSERIHVQMGEVSNSLSPFLFSSLPLSLPPFFLLSLLLLFTQIFMGHLLGVGTVLDPQDTNMKNSLDNNC